MITINPIDIKLLINKVERSITTNYICKEIINFPENASICYNITLKHSKQLEGLDFNIGDITVYKTNNIDSEYSIPIFTKDYPLLLTHINTGNINIKLYGEVDPQNVLLEYTYETIITKYQPIWAYIPVLHYIDGSFLFYKNKTINLINISDLNKYKGTFTNNVTLYKDEYIIHVYEKEEDEKNDLLKKLFNDPRILEISKLSEFCTTTLPSAYVFSIQGTENKDKFLSLAAELWDNNTVLFGRHSYKKDDDPYINFQKLADMLNK
jgi:hypothetical protein